jgi:ligand-binding sensor domain-containing protein
MRTGIVLVQLAISVSLCRAQWVQTGGPCGGPVTCIAVSLPRGAKGDTIVFAGTGGGVYRSTDNGRNWSSAGKALQNMVVTDIAVSPVVDGPDSSSKGAVFAAMSKGIFLSTDNGENWTLANSGLENITVVALAVSTDGAGGTNVYAGTYRSGVFLSVDNGSHWIPINTGLTNMDVLALAARDSYVFAGTTTGVYRSTDGGANWSVAGVGMPSVPVYAFAVRETSLYAGTYGPGGGEVFLSTNSGHNWEAVNNGLATSGVFAFAVSPDSADPFHSNLFAGTADGVFLSTDGYTWTEVNSGLKSLFIRGLGVAGTNLFAGTDDGGVFLSTNNGADWNAANAGLRASYVGALIAGSSGTSDLFAGTPGYGAFRSTDNGAHWTAVDSGLADKVVRAFALSGNNLFAGTEGGIFVSSNNGLSWMVADSSLLNTHVRAFVGSDTNLFAGTSGKGVFRSTDSGMTWTAVNNGLTSLSVFALGAGPDYGAAGSTNLYAASWGVFLSTNNGGSWAQIGHGLPTPFAVSLAVIPDPLHMSSGSLCAGVLDDGPFASGGLFLTTNSGASWTGVNTGLTTTNIRTLAVSPDGAGRMYLYAGTSDGIFLSTNYGSSWMSRNEGLTTCDVRSIIVVDTTIFCGTYGGGVWKRSLSEVTTSVPTGTEEKPSGYRLEQNYPNPFNPVTIIHYQLSTDNHVSLRVYDLLGREVTVLVNEKKGPGRYRVEFDARNLASGMYFYRLQAGSYVDVKKLILLK